MNTKELIKENGRTIKWVAKKLNMPYITLTSYLNGVRTEPKDLRERIEKII